CAASAAVRLFLAARARCAQFAASSLEEICVSSAASRSRKFDAWFRGFNTKEARGLATFDAAPELPLGRDNEMLVERIGVGGDLDPFAAAGDYREHSRSRRNYPDVMLQLRHAFRG